MTQEYAECDIEKVSTPALVHDCMHPDPADDMDGAEGANVAVVGQPNDGDIPTYRADDRKHYPQPGGVAAMVPTLIATGSTFTVPTNRQALFAETIDNEGTLVVDGSLIMVD